VAKKKVKDIVADELVDFLARNGLELYNTEFIKEGKDWFLRVYIDKLTANEETYINTDDCELVSRFLSERLDQLDPIEQNYYLEVSSPGMDRAFLKDTDYKKYKGRQVDVSLYEAIDGQKNLHGILVDLEDGILILLNEKGVKTEIPIEGVAKTCLSVIF